MASIYSCTECGANLNLNSTHLFPPDFYFEAGNKGTLSFSSIDSTKFRLEKEDKLRPFFETVDYWGIQRKRTKIKCNACGHLAGHVYDDGPPLTDSPGKARNKGTTSKPSSQAFLASKAAPSGLKGPDHVACEALHPQRKIMNYTEQIIWLVGQVF